MADNIEVLELMQAKDFAVQLRDTVTSLSRDGLDSIRCDNLLNYLNHAIQIHSDLDSVEMQNRDKAEIELLIERHKQANQLDLEMFRSVISAGQNAIKTAFLLNGGAAIALLAFIGSLVEKNLRLSHFSQKA